MRNMACRHNFNVSSLMNCMFISYKKWFQINNLCLRRLTLIERDLLHFYPGLSSWDQNQRYAGLTQSLFLIRHLQLSGVWVWIQEQWSKSIIYFKEIGPHAQNMLTILGSIIHIFGGGETYMKIWWAQESPLLWMNKIFTWAPKIMLKMATGTLIWICQSSHTNCVFHSLGEVGVERKGGNLSV